MNKWNANSTWISILAIAESGQWKFAMPLIVLLCWSFAGCRSEVAKIDSNEPNSSVAKSEGESTRVITPAQPTDEPSPAQSAENELDRLTPQLVCQQFLESLRSDDALTAGHHLTKKALFETRRADLDLGPPGGEGAQYQLGETLYATAKREVAQVECFVTEYGETSKLGWMLKKERVGWKISGMLMYGDDSIPEFIDFENREIVESIKLAMQDSTDSETARQANQSVSDENLK